MHDTNNDKEELVSHAKVNVPAEQSIRGELLPSSSSLRNIQDNPAVAYLVSLGSKRSRQTMSSFLNIVAKMIGFQNLRDCAWSSMRRHHILAVLEMLGDAGKAPATINTYLSALKGVALEAWTMKQIDTDSFQHIKQVRSVRGSRLPKGRALERHEIRSLFSHVKVIQAPKGFGMRPFSGARVACAARKSLRWTWEA
ncbi:hypothetical protein BANRA_05351 [Klebsiella pneumoniae]|nr:hypothetical protein BANRA_05351 [Klebsiella pneumoniae]